MNNDNELSVVAVRRVVRKRRDVLVSPGDPPGENASDVPSRDATTRKIRNPLLRSEETTPAVDVPVQASSLEPGEHLPPAIDGLVPPIDISENIHPFPPVFMADQKGKSSGGSKRTRHKGVAIVMAVFVAGTAVDIFLWRTSSARHARTAHLTEVGAVSTAFVTAVDLPGTASSTSTVSLVETLPDRSHSEMKLDVAKNQQCQDSEASAKVLVASRGSAGSSKSADLKLGTRRQRHGVRLAVVARSSRVAVKPKKDVWGKSSPKGGDDLGMDPRTAKSRRPTMTIDERDPYSP